MHALVAVDQPNITTWNSRRDVTDGMPANLEVVGASLSTRWYSWSINSGGWMTTRGSIGCCQRFNAYRYVRLMWDAAEQSNISHGNAAMHIDTSN